VGVADAHELVDTFVVEVGQRQAWPFLTFCDNRSTPSREVRLYIDTDCTVNGSAAWLRLEGPVALELLPLADHVVGNVRTQEAELSLTFTDGSELVISGNPAT
jgi:hypothetical protein